MKKSSVYKLDNGSLNCVLLLYLLDNSRTLRIPAAGYFNGGTRNNKGSNGNVWSSSLNTSNINNAYNLNFNDGNVNTNNNNRNNAFSVRGVVGSIYFIKLYINISYGTYFNTKTFII